MKHRFNKTEQDLTRDCWNIKFHQSHIRKIMRHKGSLSQLSKGRNKDLYDNFCRLTKRHLSLYGRVSKTLLLTQLVNAPARRYWISSERAYSVISQIRKGTLGVKPEKNICRLYYALYDEFKVYKREHPDMPDTRIAEEIIHHPAPCFGLEPRVAGIIIRKMSKQCQQEKIRRLMSRF